MGQMSRIFELVFEPSRLGYLDLVV